MTNAEHIKIAAEQVLTDDTLSYRRRQAVAQYINPMSAEKFCEKLSAEDLEEYDIENFLLNHAI